MKVMAEKCGRGGLLVYATDYFCFNNHYFKVTHKIDISTINISTLNFERKILVLLTVVQALKLLHDHSIVHSDLKPDNILIESFSDRFVSKLIDFDSSFKERDLPEPEEVMGDQVYYSPELVNYINKEDKGIEIGCASDIFSLGLIFCQYIYGMLPEFKSEYHYPCIALLRGAKLKVPESDDVPNDLKKLLQRMISFNPKERPTIKELQDDLKKIKRGKIITYKCAYCSSIYITALRPTTCECCDYNIFIICDREQDSLFSTLLRFITKFPKRLKMFISSYPNLYKVIALVLIALIFYVGYRYISFYQEDRIKEQVRQAIAALDNPAPSWSKIEKSVKILQRYNSNKNLNKLEIKEGLAKTKKIYIRWGNESLNYIDQLKCYEAAKQVDLEDDDAEVENLILETRRRLEQQRNY
jgi:serine/threonine protein kinase